MFVISGAYRYYLARTGLAGWFWNTYQLPAFFDLFAAGMLSAYLFVRARRERWWFTRRPWTAAAISAAALAAFYSLFGNLILQPGGPGAWIWQNTNRDLIAVLLAIATVFGPFGARVYRAVISNPGTRFIAFISYNLYLWNKPLLIMFTGRVSAGGGWPYGTALGIVAALGLCVAVAWFFTHFIEQPFLDRGWSALQRRKSIAEPKQAA